MARSGKSVREGEEVCRRVHSTQCCGHVPAMTNERSAAVQAGRPPAAERVPGGGRHRHARSMRCWWRLLLLPSLLGTHRDAAAAPVFDPSHPDSAPAPHSNAEWLRPGDTRARAGQAAADPAGASALDARILAQQPWLHGLLTPEGQALMWDGRTAHPGPVQADPLKKKECVWTQYKCGKLSTVGDSCRAAELPMCVHSEDVVSGAIIQTGQWGDCWTLRKMWIYQQAGSHMPPWPKARPGSVHMDVGANIGA